MEPQPPPVFSVEPPGARGPRTAGLGPYRNTLFSMLFMIAVFAWLIGNWEVAAGVVVLLFVHEMGHVVAALVFGIPISAPIFIPFVGATIIMRQNPRDAVVEAIMAYAGPLAGGVGSWICLLIAQSTGQLWLAFVALYSFQLNLFNLLPVPPLDGGRVCAAVSRWFWLPGLLVLAAAMLFFHAWQFLLIGTLILFSAFQRIKDDMRHREQMRPYYRISWWTRLLVALFYIGLIGVLLVGLAESSAVTSS